MVQQGLSILYPTPPPPLISSLFRLPAHLLESSWSISFNFSATLMPLLVSALIFLGVGAFSSIQRRTRPRDSNFARPTVTILSYMPPPSANSSCTTHRGREDREVSWWSRSGAQVFQLSWIRGMSVSNSLFKAGSTDLLRDIIIGIVIKRLECFGSLPLNPVFCPRVVEQYYSELLHSMVCRNQ